MTKTKCPICGALMPGNWADYPDYPFCTKRCRRVDLGRWLGEDYRVGGPDASDDRSTSGEGGEQPPDADR